MVQNGTKMILVLVFALAGLFAAAQVQAAETTASTVPAGAQVSDWFHNPEPWLEQGMDFRFREHGGYNWSGLNDDKLLGGRPDASFHFERYRTRLWDKFKLDENTSINIRFTWEFRTWDEPDSQSQSTDFDEIIMDNFNVSMKKFLDMPVTATIGRQDMFLGQGWLVADGTPMDGSRTFYFDAARFTYDLAEKTKLDMIFICNRPDSDWWLKPINDRGKYVTQEQENGAILYLTDKSNKDMQLEGYFMYKNNNPVDHPVVNKPLYFPQPVLEAVSKKAEIFTFGGAISGPINDNLGYRVEGAVQTGTSASPSVLVTANNEAEALRAFGGKGTLEYSFKDDIDNKVHVTYEYLSGDDPDTKRVTSFNPLWGQWPQWSEMYQPYVTKMEDNLVSNLHRLDFGHKFKPNTQWEILTDWNLLWADENTYKGNARFTDGGNFRGHLLTCWARYNFTKQLKGNLVGEYMMPGNYYSQANNDDGVYFHFTVEYTF